MLRVGVTGGIGSGKSFVCAIISAMGYPVYNADNEARILTDTHPTIIKGVVGIFGNNIYVDNKLNRKQVGAIVFGDKEKLAQLNAIVHPVVEQHFLHWIRSHSASPLVFKESAILFESGAEKLVDKTIAVWAPVDTRIERILRRDSLGKVEVTKRMLNQMQQDELVKRANYVIRNNDDELILPQIYSIVEELKTIQKQITS